MDEFDVYFQRAKNDEDLGELQQASFRPKEKSLAKTGRRGSVPSIIVQPKESNIAHKRTLSCRAPRRNTNYSPHALLNSPLSGKSIEETSDSIRDIPHHSHHKPSKRNPRLDKELDTLKAKPLITTTKTNSQSQSQSLHQHQPQTIAEQDLLLLEQNEDVCVVRSFETSSRGIVSRGDSIKRKQPIAQDKRLPTLETVQESNGYESIKSGVDGYESLKPGVDGYSTTKSGVDGHESTKSGSVSSKPKSKDSGSVGHRVLFIGDQRVGKTALINQLLSSEHMGTTAEMLLDDKFVRSVSVEIDGVETMMELEEVKTAKTFPELPSTASALVLVYAVDEHQSFLYVRDILQEVRQRGLNPGAATILVANKADLVRSRDVKQEEAFEVCKSYQSKFIEISCALNHQVDEMLVGLVTQIRLNKKRLMRQRTLTDSGSLTCLSSLAFRIRDMLCHSKQDEKYEVDNMNVL